ncbi:hypothetical protein D9M68_906770 [compost metagenome]
MAAASPRPATIDLMVPKMESLLWKEAACCCSGTSGARSSATSLVTMPWMSMPLARPGDEMAMRNPFRDEHRARRGHALC